MIKLNSLRSPWYLNSLQFFFAINPNIPWKSFPWDAWTHSKKNTWKKVCKSFLFKVEIQQFWLCNFFLWSNLKSYLIEKFHSNNFRFRDDLKWVCFIALWNFIENNWNNRTLQSTMKHVLQRGKVNVFGRQKFIFNLSKII